jgi:hypothetical protein
MFQRDYILRMIEMLGDLIAGILGLIKKGEFDKASQSLDNVYYEMLREDASFFRKIPNNELTKQLLQDHHYTHGHLEILAELFYAQAELAFAQNQIDESMEFYQKSLILLEFVVKESNTFSMEKQGKLEMLRQKINNA